MSEQIVWNPEIGVMIAKDLNANGTLVKNAIAGMYNTFRYQVSQVWSGKNYNRAVAALNFHIDRFRYITNYIGVEIPNVIQEISEMHAANGGGTVEARRYTLTSDGNNPDIYEVPESNVSADGSLRITEEAKKFFNGEEYPSVRYAGNLAIQYFVNYLSSFDSQFEMFSQNDAIKEIHNKAVSYKVEMESTINSIISEIESVANEEIGKIDTGNVETVEVSKKSTIGCVTSKGTGDTRTSSNEDSFKVIKSNEELKDLDVDLSKAKPASDEGLEEKWVDSLSDKNNSQSTTPSTPSNSVPKADSKPSTAPSSSNDSKNSSNSSSTATPSSKPTTDSKATSEDVTKAADTLQKAVTNKDTNSNSGNLSGQELWDAVKKLNNDK